MSQIKYADGIAASERWESKHLDWEHWVSGQQQGDGTICKSSRLSWGT